jgi:uncharacterized phage protein gp47/JayE
MINPLDIIPIKTFDDLMAAGKTKLRDLSFRITNLRPGGVFYTLLEMANQGLADLYELLRDNTPNLYLDTAEGDWLDFKAAEYEVYRKAAQKTQGNVTFGRSASSGNVVIPAGTIVATPVDAAGDSLQFSVITQTVLPDGQTTITVPVEAEFAAANYNVGTGLINHLVTYIAGIDYVSNSEDWITREGTDEETDDSLRLRVSLRWQQLSTGAGRDAYISWAQEIPGVAVINIDDQHPRGQGSIDVIITSAAGIPSQALIDEVQSHLDIKKPLTANVLALGPTPVTIDWDIDLYVDPDHGDLDEIEAQAAQIIDIMFMYGDTDHPEIKKVSTSLGVICAQAIANLMTIENVDNVVINQPAADVPITARQLAIKGTVTVTAERIS